VAITIRFHGRFVYDEHEGGFSVLAPRFDAPFAPHQPLMSIPFDQLKFFDNPSEESNDPRRQITTFDPKLRIATGGDAKTPQTLIWDLSGLRVTYSGSPRPATLAGAAKVPELATLEQARSAPLPKLAQNARRLEAGGLTNAIVDVGAGTGMGVTPLSDLAKFVRGGDARLLDMAAKGVEGIEAPTLKFARDPNDNDADLKMRVAESVDFTVNPEDKAEKNPVLTMTFANADGTVVGQVTVKDGATVAFSNLCAPLHEPGHHDLEFSQFYQLLEASPGDDGLVPSLKASALSEAFPCVASAKTKK
jgi:hypothetical protein